MDYRWNVTDTGRRSPGTCVPMVAQIPQRNVDVVKSMLPSAAARPGFNSIEDAMHHRGDNTDFSMSHPPEMAHSGLHPRNFTPSLPRVFPCFRAHFIGSITFTP